MLLLGPLAMLGVGVGTNLLSGALGKMFGGGGGPRTDPAVAEKMRTENRIMTMREEWLRQLMGEREDFEKALINERTGKPLVLRLPGVGGISGDKWSQFLDDMTNSIDFGGKRSKDFAMALLSQMTPGSNSAAASAASYGQGADRQAENIAGASRMARDVITGATDLLIDKFGGPQAPAPVTPTEFADMPIVGNPDAPIDLTAMLDASIPPTGGR